MYNTAICLLIKDENAYINEWLQWHISQGFEHFFIYDNGSKVPIRDSVFPEYVPLCTFVDFSVGYCCLQADCYAHCLQHYGGFTRWLAFIDTDEFIRTVNGENVNAFLRDFARYDGLFVPWIMYNANGLHHKDSRPQRERFTQVADYNEWKPCGKSIIQPSRVQRMGTHFPQQIPGHYYIVDGDKNFMRTAMDTPRGKSKIVIDHYFTRSLEEWLEKAQRGSCDPRVKRDYAEFYLYNPEMLEVEREQNQHTPTP